METVSQGLIAEDLTGRFEKFFRTYYNRELLRVVHGYPEEKSLWVNFDDLDKYDIALADEVISNPDSAVPAAERALKSIDLPVDLPSMRVNVRFYNLPTTSRIMIKDIRSEHVGKFMIVEGIVRKATDVRPKLVLGAFECQRCGNITRISQETQKLKEPFLCEDCERKGPFKLLVQESTFVDSQKILIQESLEDLRGGEHPKQLSIFIEDDLTGKISPGDRVELTGTLRAVKKGFKDKRSRVFEIYLDTNSFKPIELDFEEVEITGVDEKRIIELSKDSLVYENIRDSIAPHIYGYADIKEAIMYQLFSAPPLDLPDGGRIRGDSHIIIMGEPATGKCVSGDTVICLEKGKLIKIKDLVDSIFEKNATFKTVDGRLYSELKEPLFVPSINDSLKIENRRVTHVWRRKYTGRILRVITQSGKSIRVTPEHPFFVVRDGRVTYIPAEELGPGERIATPRIIPVIGESHDLGSVTSANFRRYEIEKRHPSRKKLLEAVEILTEPILCDGGKRPECFDNLNALGRLASSDIFWDKVNKIEVERSCEEYVYDLTVEGRHNFIANGIIVHNSEILQYVAKELAPRGVYASGKGTSAAGLCVAPSSLVCLENGVLLPIGDLVEKELEKGNKEYRKGIWIAGNPEIRRSAFALNGGEKLEPKKIVQYWKLRAPTKVIRITTKTGREIEITQETPLFSASRDKSMWKKAKFLRTGDFLASARDLKTDQNEVPLCIDLIKSDPIVYGAEDIIRDAINLLKEKNGLTTRELSKRSGVNENKLYHAWVNPKAKGKPRLSEVLKVTSHPTISRKKVAGAIKSFSQYHGHRITLPMRVNEDLLYLAGLIAGDGDLAKTPFGGCSIRFSSSSQGMLKNFKTLTKNLFGVDAVVNTGSKIRPPSARFHSKLVGEILQRLGIPFSPKSHRIDLTPELLGLPDEFLAQYISGLFDCDGCVVRRGRKGSSYIEYVTTSENLAKKLHLSLLRFGIISKLKKRPAIGQKTEFYVDQERREIESRHDKYHIYVRGKSNLLAFKERIGFKHEEKIKTLDEVVKDIRRSSTNFDSVPFAGAIMKEIREAFGLSSREIFGYKNYNHEQGFFKPSVRFVKNFIERVDLLKGNYKERIYLEVENSLKKELYEKAKIHLSRGELSKLLGKKESALDEYFFRRSKRVKIPYSTLETLCNFLEDRGYKHCSFKQISKRVNPPLTKIKDRILKAEEKLKELKTFTNVLWEEIVNVEWRKPGYDYVYDLTIRDTHNFLVNGVISHNTAAAIKDEFADGGWSLEAGALVLADKGVACIDEFDKMEKDDRSAMHEAMEQQTVSIAKAGIIATFRARCSILAAANPKFGRFDDYRSISEQVNLPPTILSRFDLIFFVRDVLEETREVAKHILNTVVSPDSIVPKLGPEFLRKYIAYARQNINPVLSENARERIEQFYVEMREVARNAEDTPIPLTARQLWAILRISRAASRVRLSNETTLEDVERAIRLVKVSLKQAGMDLETGKVDIDKIMVGVTKSQRDRITHILEIIREIENEYGTAKKTEIIARAMEEGITEGEAEKAIEKLRADGHIYDPRRDDRYKVV